MMDSILRGRSIRRRRTVRAEEASIGQSVSRAVINRINGDEPRSARATNYDYVKNLCAPIASLRRSAKESGRSRFLLYWPKASMKVNAIMATRPLTFSAAGVQKVGRSPSG